MNSYYKIKKAQPLLKKGCEGIKKASEQRGDETIVTPGQKIHKKCRQEYCNTKAIESFRRKTKCDQDQDIAHSLRTSCNPFEYREVWWEKDRL